MLVEVWMNYLNSLFLGLAHQYYSATDGWERPLNRIGQALSHNPVYSLLLPSTVQILLVDKYGHNP